MKEYWIRLKVCADGTISTLDAFRKKDVVRELIGNLEGSRRDFFEITREDRGDVLAVKKAAEALGGPLWLAKEMGVTRPALYQWIKRGKIGKHYKESVYAVASGISDVTIRQRLAEKDDYENYEDGVDE